MTRSVTCLAAGILAATTCSAAAGLADSSAAGADLPLISPDKPLGGWAFGDGPEFPGAKGELVVDDAVEPARRPALRLRGDFRGGGNYVQAGIGLPEKDIEALSLRIKAPGAEQVTLRLVDASDQCHQLKLRLKKADGWQSVYLPLAELFRRMGTASSLPVVARYEKWGGANDGKWHGPGKGLYVLLGRGTFPDGAPGALWLSDVRLVPTRSSGGRKTSVTKTIRLDELLQEGEVDWAFTLGQEFPGAKGALEAVPDQPRAGSCALRMRGDFSGGGAYVAATKMLTGLSVRSVPAIRLRMRSETVKSYSVRVVDATGQWHQKKRIPFEADGTWHEVSVAPAEIAGGEHWGGANDGKWHAPAGGLSIVIGKPSNPDSPKMDLLIADARAEVTLAARLQPVAYKEGFEQAAPLPAGWRADGDVRAVAAGAFGGKKCLQLARTLAQRGDETRAVGAAFSGPGGTWQVTGACASELHSPDNSYHGAVAVEALGPGGAVLERVVVHTQFGQRAWQSFTKQVELPTGTAQVRFAVQLNKAYGTVRVDDLSAAYVVATEAAEKRVDRILLATDRLGNLLLPGDKPVVHVTVEALKPLPKYERRIACTLRDYWGAEQALPIWRPLERTGRGKGKFVYRADVDLGAAGIETGRYYEVHVQIPREAGEPYRERTGLACLPVAETKRHAPAEVPFTIRNWDNRIKPYFFLADRIGIRQLGIWGGWKSAAPYAPHAPGIQWCKELGAKWATNTPAHAVEKEGFTTYDEKALREGMRAFLAKYAHQGMIAMCLGNEPHGDVAKIRENVRAYKVLYEAAKAFDPNVFVIGTSVPPDERYFQAGYHKYLDAYDFHVYEDPAGVRRQVREYKRLMAKYGAPRPVYSTELGLNSQGMTRHAVAMDMVKKLTVFFAAGGANVSWFTIQYPDPKGKARGTFGDAHCVFDCQYNQYNPRIDAITYYHMVNGLCVKKFVAERQYPGGVQAYLFRDKAGQCLQVLWRDEGYEDVLVPLADVPGVELVRIDGSRAKLTPAGGGVTLRVSREPLLLRYRQARGGLAEALRTPAVALAAAPGAVLKGGACSMVLRGPGLKPEALGVLVPPRWSATLKQAGADRVECAITAPAETTARAGRVLVQCRNASGAPSGELALRLAITRPIAVEVYPVPAAGGEGERLELRIRNNGRETVDLRWELALDRELPMERGVYDLAGGRTPSAWLKGASTGRLALPASTEKRIRVALAEMDPLTIYRVRATVTDPLGRAVECERFVGGFAAAHKAVKAPTIDGTLGEADWRRAPAVSISQARQVHVLGGGATETQWSGKADLAGRVRFLWDARHLYLGVTVTDDVFRGVRCDGSLWNQDGLQFLADPRRPDAVKTGKYDYSVGLGTKGPQAWCHLSGSGSVPVGEAKGFRVAARRAGGGGNVTYELAIPWANLAPFRPHAGADLGLSVILNEDDGAGRTGFMGWFSDAHSKQLDMVGDVILLGD